MSRPRTNPKRTLLIAAAVLVLLALLPSRFTRAATSLAAEPAIIALAPPARLFTLVADFLRPTRVRGMSGDPAILEVENARDEYRRRWRRAEQRVGELERLLTELQRGRALIADVSYTPFATPVIGRATDPSSGQLVVRGGRDRAVNPGAVVTTAGVHLVGRVSAVNARTSEIVPITHPATRWIRVVVDNGTDAPLPGAQIQPAGPGARGLLRGELDADAPPVEVGMLVRLADDTWPASARSMVVGEVVEVAPKDSQPLRTVITVRPMIDPTRVSQVFLWLPDSPAIPGAPGTPGSPGAPGAPGSPAAQEGTR